MECGSQYILYEEAFMDTKKGRAVYWIAGLSALMLAGSIGVMSDPAQAKNEVPAKESSKAKFQPMRAMPMGFS